MASIRLLLSAVRTGVHAECHALQGVVAYNRLAELYQLRRIQVGKVEQILGRKRTRTLEIMRKLDRKHENLKYKNLGGNKGSYLYWKD